MDDWFKKKAIHFVKKSTASYVWLALCVWVMGAWLSNLMSHWSHVNSVVPAYREVATYLLLIAITLIFRARLLGPSWFLFGALLIYIWTANIAKDLSGRVTWIILLFLMLLAYFTLEGVELAVTELRDKDPDVFNDPTISETIQNINKKRELFYDAREWIIVLLVVFLSIKSDFDAIWLPGMGLIKSPHAHTIFSLLFTTFIVVWLCQSPSKVLATKNSVAFLKLSQFPRIWPYMRVIGTVVEQINLQEPSKVIVGKFSKFKAFREPRDLRPSDAAYFLYGLKVFGYGLFKLHEKLTLEADGTSTFTQRGLFYVIDNDRKEFGRWYEFDSEFREVNRSVWAYFAPRPGETLTEELQGELENAFSDRPPGDGYLKCDVDPRFAETERVMPGDSPKNDAGVRRDYLIEIEMPIGNSRAALAVGFEISFSIDQKGFKLPSGAHGNDKVNDFLHKDVNFPWRSYELEAKLNVEGNTRFAHVYGKATILQAENKRETAKMLNVSQKKYFIGSISYPLIGAKYVWRWEVWH